VAGIDIAKAKADVCTRLPAARDGGRRASRLEEVPATAREITALAGRLLADRVELVVMEATSDYWRIWYYLLETAGLTVQLVNPAHARQLAGRPKTGWTRSSSPGWPRWACCARRSCRPRRSARCGT
jgi:transposase